MDAQPSAMGRMYVERCRLLDFRQPGCVKKRTGFVFEPDIWQWPINSKSFELVLAFF